MSELIEKTILIVDDHDDDRALLEQLFKSRKYHVLLANNGDVALEILTAQPVDLVFSDVLMPVMDGLQLCRMIKSSDELKHIPVVLYSSIYSNEDDIKQSEEAGAERYVIKPIEPKKLLVILDQILDKPAFQSVSIKNVSSVSFSGDREKYLRLYSTQLVKRLEKEVSNLGEEIAKRKKIEEEQREILNSMSDGVISTDETGVILSFNKAAEGLFGYAAKEVIGEDISQLIPEPFASLHNGDIQNYVESGEAHVFGYGCEVVGLCKNGVTFPMRLKLAELSRNAEGKRRFIGSCQDITQLKQQEQQLRRSQKMDALGKLTGGIAHDNNNMLGVILGYAELLRGELDDQPKLAKYVQQIRRAGERGAKLARKLLAFSQQETSDAQVLDINLLLLEEQHILETTLTARISLVLDLAEDLWSVWLDSAELEDAILNMSINAMHAINGNGQLTIQTCNETIGKYSAEILQVETGDYVLLSISDTGCGMDDTTKEKIFDPFFSTKGENGTGLGLSQVYGFIERSGGAIDVYSEVGEGSRFSLYIPRFHNSCNNDISKQYNYESELRGHETILIVDDESALLELAVEILEMQGYQIKSADNAKQALQIMEAEEIDLLLSDVIMPDMSGYQLAAIVQEKYPTVKVQLTSGFTNERHRNLVEDELYKNLLHKPYQTKVLLKKVREQLDSTVNL